MHKTSSTPGSFGTEKPRSSPGQRLSVNAAPQTRTPSSGSVTASMRGERKICTFSGNVRRAYGAPAL